MLTYTPPFAGGACDGRVCPSLFSHAPPTRVPGSNQTLLGPALRMSRQTSLLKFRIGIFLANI